MKGDPCDPHLLEEGRGGGGKGAEIGLASPPLPPYGVDATKKGTIFLADDGNSDGYGTDDDDDDGNVDIEDNDGGGGVDDGGNRTKKRVT